MQLLLLALSAFLASAYAAPSSTQSAAPTGTPGIKLPILTDRSLPHPRNKNLEGEALLSWMSQQRNHVHAKYGKGGSGKRRHVEARQAAPLGMVTMGGFYYTQIGLGTPEKTYSVVLDTGSADFWIAGTSCSGCEKMKLYDPSKSSSFKSSEQRFQIPYGQGGVKGVLGADDVSLAGYKVEGLNFGRATDLAQGTTRAPASGIMGMGFESLSSSGATPFWQVVSIEGKLKDPVFSFQLVSDKMDASSAGQETAGGVFTLGNLDDQQFSGEITWVDLASQYGSKGMGYWGIKMDAFEVNGKNIPLGDNNLVAVDTGTTLIGAPESIVKAAYQQIPHAKPSSSSSSGGQGYYVFPCSQSFEIKLTFGGKAFSLNQDDLNIGMVDAREKMCGGALFVAQVPDGAHVPAWILGDTFLSKVYSVYSWQPERVGFASLPQNGPKTLALTSTKGGQDGSASAAPGGGGGISQPASRSQMHETGVVGAGGLPTPKLVSVPSGMQTLSAPKSLPTGHGGGAGGGGFGQASKITVHNSAEWNSLTSRFGEGGGGLFSIFNGSSAMHRADGIRVALVTLVAAALAACLLL